MIPFFQYNIIQIGPLNIQVWGLLVAIGIVAAVLYAGRLIKIYVLSEDVLLDLSIWVLIFSFLFARVFHVLFYNLAYYLLNPGEVYKFWHGGLSSLGGFFGAGAALYFFAKWRHFRLKELWPYFDIMAVSFWLGWGIGRLGCFLIHDHPGVLTDFFLGVQFPNGTRFDLGLMDSIVGFALFALFAPLFKRLVKIRFGLVTIYSVMLYAVARFFLDFLRATDLPESDVRYGNLTPAQWGMLVVALALTGWLISSKIGRRKSDSPLGRGRGGLEEKK